MSDYLKHLKKIIRDHPLEEKIMVVSSNRVGRQIGEILALQGFSWTNLRYASSRALAMETVSLEMAESGFRPIPDVTQFFLLESIFGSIKKQGKKSYFTGLESETGIIRNFQRSISDLRREGLTSADLSPGQFEDESKGRELIYIIQQYEKELNREKWLDEAGIYRLALEKMPESASIGNPLVLYFQNRAPAGLTRRFLEAYSQRRIVWLIRAPIAGLSPPRRYKETVKTDPEPIDAVSQIYSWLFAPGKAPSFNEDEAPEIFSAVGAVNECREILRRIYRDGHRFDEVEIIYPGGSVYASHLFSLCRRNGINISFAEGLELGWTSPGKLFFGLLDWMESGYQTRMITRLIGSRTMVLEKNVPELTPEAAVEIIHASKIGWGKSRYQERLEHLKNKKEKIQPENKEEQERKQKDLITVSELIVFFKRIFAKLPDVSQSVRLRMKDFCEKLIQILNEFAVINNEMDEEAVRVLQRRLTEASWIDSEPKTSADIFSWVRSLADTVKIQASAPMPGRIYASSYTSGGFSGRKITFACGMDQGRFPGFGQEDPILLDKERTAVSENLSLSTDELRENLFDIAELFASIKGRLILSFPVYDLVEEREAFPSSLILQAFRLQQRNEKLDYSELMEAVSPEAGFIPDSPENALDSPEWWFARLLVRGHLRNAGESVRSQYPGLDAGLKAREERELERLTEFDGNIGVLPPALNPLDNPEKILSASSLEELAECPYKYFLHHIMGLEPPEEIEYDPARWLDPMERGSLLHEIYCDFMTELTRKGEHLESGRHRALIKDIAESKLSRALRKTPPPSQAVYAKERKEIMDSLDIFLDLELINNDSRPLLFEAPFGMSNKQRSVKPVKIPAGGKTIFLRGIIDRIDEIGRNTYRVIDYKTGGYKKYEDLGQFNEGKILQCALYALAAREIIRSCGLSDAPEIKESGYFFPTLKGEGRKIYIPPPSWESLSDMLGELLTWLEKGLFPVHPKANCHYCDYQMVCGRDTVNREKNKSDPEINKIFNNLKNYK